MSERNRITQRHLLWTVVSLVALASVASAFQATRPAPPAKPRPPARVSYPPVAEGTTAVVETELGSFTILLLPSVAPQHVQSFVKTAKAGGYDGTTFHRLIAGGIIQGGDPLSKDPAQSARYGTGGLGLLKAEFSDRPFVRGVVAAARRPSSPDSGGVQFFVVVREQPSLLGQYTILGEVTEGMDVVDKISMEPVTGDRATNRIEMKVKIQTP
jgi:cyclophilin family peptidyl-prolyl cis-trans isomerase